MGSVLYDFLADSLLFDSDNIEDAYQNVSSAELDEELARYRTFASQNAAAVGDEVRGKNSNLTVVSDEPFGQVNLTQAALYVNQYIFDDPLLAASPVRSQTARTFNQFASGSADDATDRRRVAHAAKIMKQVTPLVAGDFIKFLPLSETDDSLMDGMPIRHSDVLFEDVLPTEVLRLFKEAAVVKSLRRVPAGLAVEKTLYPCRQVSINFKGHPSHKGMLYMLFDQAVSIVDEGKGLFNARLSLPENQPDDKQFNVWVRQSVNQASAALFHQTERQLSQAASLNAVVSSRSELLFRAIRAVYKPSSTVPMRTANVFLNLKLPFIKDLKVEDLVHLRQQEGESFHRFRLLLDQKLGCIRSAPGSEEAQREAEMAIHELTEIRMSEINDKLKGVRDKLAANSVLAAVGFVGAIQTGGVSLLASATAAVNVGKTYLDYRNDVKRNPAFFLWKALK